MSDEDDQAITRLLIDWRSGDQQSLPKLMTALQDQLRMMAHQRFSRERISHTLQPTALVSELYLRLQQGVEVDWRDRAHFFAVSASIMRRILVDHARKFIRSSGSGERLSMTMAEALLPEVKDEVAILDLDKALNKLKETDESQHEVVMLRFFGGLTMEEIAAVTGTTERTIQRKWAAARVLMLAYLKGVV